MRRLCRNTEDAPVVVEDIRWQPEVRMLIRLAAPTIVQGEAIQQLQSTNSSTALDSVSGLLGAVSCDVHRRGAAGDDGHRPGVCWSPGNQRPGGLCPGDNLQQHHVVRVLCRRQSCAYDPVSCPCQRGGSAVCAKLACPHYVPACGQGGAWCLPSPAALILCNRCYMRRGQVLLAGLLNCARHAGSAGVW